MTRQSKIPPVLSLPIIADLAPRGDGTFILKPRVIELADEDTWISPKDAARVVGVSLTEVYGLLDAAEPFLVSRRPARWKILVSLKSALAFRRATVKEDFWEAAGRTARDTLLASNRAALMELAAPAM
jgi:hypothetical protein